MYKLIAIDIDGTLLNDRHEVTDEVREAIIEAKKQGIKIVLCSGRAVGGVVRFLEELELKGEDNYIVALNGALILNASTSEVIHKQNLSLEDLQNLYKLSQEFKTCIVFFDEADIFILNKDIPKYIVQEAFLSQVNLYYRDIEEITDDYIVSNVLFVDEPGASSSKSFHLSRQSLKKNMQWSKVLLIILNFYIRNPVKGMR